MIMEVISLIITNDTQFRKKKYDNGGFSTVVPGPYMAEVSWPQPLSSGAAL